MERTIEIGFTSRSYKSAKRAKNQGKFHERIIKIRVSGLPLTPVKCTSMLWLLFSFALHVQFTFSSCRFVLFRSGYSKTNTATLVTHGKCGIVQWAWQG